MNIGEIVNLKVIRLSDLGYMLSDGKQDVLMHFNEAQDKYNIGDMVDAFLFFDKKGRICATTKTPSVTLSKEGFATVVSVQSGFGVFISNNTSKDLLVSSDYLPYSQSKWPRVGESILVKLKVKEDSMTARVLNRGEINDLYTGVRYAEGEKVMATVIKTAESGIGCVTNDYAYVFVPNFLLRGEYHIGQSVMVEITKENGKKEYYGSLIARKEEMIDTDTKIILDYLNAHNGSMPYTAKSSAEEIEATFKISRKAFKRALGKLYKDKIVETNDVETILV